MTAVNLCRYDPFRGFLRAIDTYIVTEFADEGHIKIILFNWCEAPLQYLRYQCCCADPTFWRRTSPAHAMQLLCTWLALSLCTAYALLSAYSSLSCCEYNTRSICGPGGSSTDFVKCMHAYVCVSRRFICMLLLTGSCAA